MSLLDYIMLHHAYDAELSDTIQSYLENFSPHKQLVVLREFFQQATEIDELHTRSVARTWDYLEERSLWQNEYSSLEIFKEAIGFTTFVQPFLERHSQLSARAKSERNNILEHWNIDIDDVFPHDIRPAHLSVSLLYNLSKLCRMVPHKDAIDRLRLQINHRRRKKHMSRLKSVQVADIKQVIESLRSATTATPNCVTPKSTYSISSAEPRVRRSPRKPKGGTSTAVLQTNTRSTTSSATVQEKTCSCSEGFQQRLSLRSKLKTENELIELFVFMVQFELSSACWDHLRVCAGYTVGLICNISRETLTEHIKFVYDNLSSLSELRNSTNPTWFRRNYRSLMETELLEPYRYPHIEPPEISIDPKLLFARYASVELYQLWLSDGTIILPLLDYLDRPEIKAAIDTEFEMYLHHFQENSSRPAMGFLRNMFFSLTQQLVRQDPVWYVMQVACRPDHCPRLIAYPYVAKYAQPGGSTGFLHMDINLGKFLSEGECQSQLTSSVSLDDEEEDGCTLLVPGFFRHAEEWHNRTVSRDRCATNGVTTDASKNYLPEDERDFGRAIPMPCPAFGVRITRPDMIHGSTSKASRRRRVIYPWYTSIKADHSTLERPGQLTWEEISQSHRDLEAPLRGVGGDQVTRDRPAYRFPAALSMNSSSPLCDALIGRRRWDDPSVLVERDMVLGDNDAVARSYVSATRELLVKNFLLAMGQVEEIERQVFGSNSFFRQRYENSAIQL